MSTVTGMHILTIQSTNLIIVSLGGVERNNNKNSEEDNKSDTQSHEILVCTEPFAMSTNRVMLNKTGCGTTATFNHAANATPAAALHTSPQPSITRTQRMFPCSL
jgi:hypothetical protein